MISFVALGNVILLLLLLKLPPAMNDPPPGVPGRRGPTLRLLAAKMPTLKTLTYPQLHLFQRKQAATRGWISGLDRFRPELAMNCSSNR